MTPRVSCFPDRAHLDAHGRWKRTVRRGMSTRRQTLISAFLMISPNEARSRSMVAPNVGESW